MHKCMQTHHTGRNYSEMGPHPRIIKYVVVSGACDMDMYVCVNVSALLYARVCANKSYR